MRGTEPSRESRKSSAFWALEQLVIGGDDTTVEGAKKFAAGLQNAELKFSRGKQDEEDRKIIEYERERTKKALRGILDQYQKLNGGEKAKYKEIALERRETLRRLVSTLEDGKDGKIGYETVLARIEFLITILRLEDKSA